MSDLPDLSDVIEGFETGTYTVTRSVPAGYGADGRADAPTTSTLSITASVQPISGRELERLPEGLRTAEVQAVWTQTELRTQGPGYLPDSISIDGEAWEVQRVERWSTLGGYFKAYVAKVGH